MKRTLVRFVYLLTLALTVVGARPVLATNGMNVIGFGAVSPAMGGADLAMVDNPTAMNINPAGICLCKSPEIGVGLSLLNPRLEHEDHIGNDQEGENHFFPLPMLTYAQPIAGHNLNWGIGIFSQGGMGADFDSMQSPFAAMGLGALPGQTAPDSDRVFSDVRYVKVTPTLAWHSADNRLKIGASLNLGYAETEMKYFPNTSLFLDMDGNGDANGAGELAFAGMDMQDLKAVGLGYRVGFQYGVGALRIGGAYLSRTSLDFDDGSMMLNMTATGLGRVKYDAEMDGFSWPQQAGLGFSYRLADNLRVAVDVDWIDWAGALETIRIKLSKPSNPAAPSKQTIVFPMEWEEQWVYAIGFEYVPINNLILRLGFNHGSSPVPNRTLSPLFPAITEDHLTGGIGTRCGAWKFDLGVEWALPAEASNDNADPAVNPFGVGSEETHSQVLLHMMVRKSF